MDTKKVGQLIRTERLRQGMSGEELGSIIGVGKAQISKIENGRVSTLKTLVRAADALGVALDVRLSVDKEASKRVVGYVVACIHLFAATFGMTVREATNYLNRYKGVAFLTTHYEAEHLLSLEDTVHDLARICCNNGGGVQ